MCVGGGDVTTACRALKGAKSISVSEEKPPAAISHCDLQVDGMHPQLLDSARSEGGLGLRQRRPVMGRLRDMLYRRKDGGKGVSKMRRSDALK